MATPARKQNGENATPKARSGPGRFSIYVDAALGDKIRRYCFKHRIAFNDLALAAITYFMEHKEPPKPEPNIRRGTRLRPPA